MIEKVICSMLIYTTLIITIIIINVLLLSLLLELGNIACVVVIIICTTITIINEVQLTHKL